MSLTANAVQRIYTTQAVADDPVVQIVDLRPIEAPGGQRRYRCQVSDGVHQMAMMLTTALNELVEKNVIQNFSVVRLKKGSVNEVQGRRILIALEMDHVAARTSQLGNASLVQAHAAFSQGGGSQGGGSSAVGSAIPAASSAAAPASAAGGRAPWAVSAAAGGGGGGGGAVVSSGTLSSAHCTPIATLNPYNSKWTIKVRVTKKDPVRTWSNAKGEGKLFSVDLLDEHGGEIRATFFKEAVDRFEQSLVPGSVYLMSGGRLKPANKTYSSLKSDYEISFDERATIEAVRDEGKIGSVNFNFTPLEKLELKDPGAMVDVVGVIKEATDAASITSKQGQELRKRSVTLADNSGVSIELTFWGEGIAQLETGAGGGDVRGHVVAVKGAKLGDFGGRSLSSLRSSTVLVDPDLDVTTKLQAWWRAGGESAASRALTSARGSGDGAGRATGPISVPAKRRTLQWVKDNQAMFAQQERPDLITVKGTIAYTNATVDRPPWYPACPTPVPDDRPAAAGGGGGGGTRICNKRVTPEMGDASGTRWTCTRCGPIRAPEYRYIYSCVLADPTSSQMVTFFDESAQALLGCPASDLVPIVRAAEAGDKAEAARAEKAFKVPLFRQLFVKLRCRMESVRDEIRLQCTAIESKPVDFEYESARLAEAIESFTT